MTWIKVDDRAPDHVKFAKVGPLGTALWFAGMAYCNRNLTDGFIPWSVAERLVTWDFLTASGRTRILLDDGDDDPTPVTCAFVGQLLVNAGLWERVDDGYQVHDYADYQPTRAEVEAQRATKSAAGRAGAEAAARARAGQQVGERRSKAEAEQSPVPVPVPRTSTSSAKRSVSQPLKDARDWLALHDVARPVGWVNALLKELSEKFGADRVIAIWERAPGDVKTSKQYVQLAEKMLAPAPNGSTIAQTRPRPPVDPLLEQQRRAYRERYGPDEEVQH